MKKESAMILNGLLNEMLEAVKDLEFAEKNKNVEGLGQAKIKILSLQKKIDEKI